MDATFEPPGGSYGIHGTNNPMSIGQMASAGCVRMFNEDVAELYEWVNIGGALVVLKRGGTVSPMRALLNRSGGQDVVYLQWRLRQLGLIRAEQMVFWRRNSSSGSGLAKIPRT